MDISAQPLSRPYSTSDRFRRAAAATIVMVIVIVIERVGVIVLVVAIANIHSNSNNKSASDPSFTSDSESTAVVMAIMTAAHSPVDASGDARGNVHFIPTMLVDNVKADEIKPTVHSHSHLSRHSIPVGEVYRATVPR